MAPSCRSGTGGSVRDGGLGPYIDQTATIVHREVSRMPDTPDTAELEALIRALISKANDCLQRQLDDVRRNAEGEQSHEQDALADAS
jgi:glutamyl-tRNA reductase